MDFTPSEASADLAALTRRLLADKATHDPHGTGGFDTVSWTTLGQAGVLDAALPSSLGGGGFGLPEQCAVLTEIGRAVAAVPYLSSITMAASALAEFGTPELVDRWVLPVLRGERVLAVALSGFTASDGRVSGAQTAVPFGAFAHGFLVATSDEVFLVDASASGVTVRPQQTTDHADAALLELSDVPGVPLGDIGEWLRLRGTVGVCAQQLGVVERALELTAAYAAERKQFDHVIGGFQAVRQRLADAYLDVEAVRLTTLQAAWQLTSDVPAAAEAVATAKFWAAEAGHRVAHTAVHVHGGVGIDVDHVVHRYFAAAKRLEFQLGAATQQLLALGERLADRG
ncbi:MULTISPECIES: acyl-CoA dehydrogenase family protein [unclassified Amycolatopsis]|uniref:acyl-CoA dehydrogenase family protein n=1 Tax=unclassified Amycolatopsis TaxID=2618356 RepID=UPI00287476DA|nr:MULTISPECIES: acyl-CoA dehydrogenase family protein [unclassified Amycolatopsis]MDS0139670.1 acyl-CoA dehydrogenase family protein [Amycolatopsis sp. 505]MDS0145093.1 acyl-CoA dehydrogenase family protein [Amycolatopsis sp. CM201R]